MLPLAFCPIAASTGLRGVPVRDESSVAEDNLGGMRDYIARVVCEDIAKLS